jgi:hypothetical protein
VLIYGKSLPKKSQVHSRFFERENIVEMIVLEVEKDFALKSKFKKIKRFLSIEIILDLLKNTLTFNSNN